MAHSYREWWQWELQQQKKAMQGIRGGAQVSKVPHLLEIDETLLVDPVVGESEMYVGQRSFAIVKIMIFRGIKVAIKEFTAFHTVVGH